METIKLPLFVAVLALFVAFATAAKPAKPTAKLVGGGTTADVGVIKILCERVATDALTFKFYEDATAVSAGVSGAELTITKAVGTFKFTCTGLDGTSGTKLVSDTSDVLTVVVSALVAPTISSAPVATGDKLSAACNSKVTFTCNKADANKAAKEYRFTVDGTAVMPAASGATFTRTLTKDDDGKRFKCTFYNTDAAKKDSSNEITITVTGCPDDKSSAVTHVVSLTTMGLFLVLGAIFRE